MTNYKQRLLSRIIYIVVSNILNVKYFFFLVFRFVGF